MCSRLGPGPQVWAGPSAAPRCCVRGLVSRWVGLCATRSHTAVRLELVQEGRGRGGRGAGPPAATPLSRVHSWFSCPGRRSTRAESAVPTGLGDRGWRELGAGPRRTEVSQDPVPGAGPQRLEVIRDPVRTQAGAHSRQGASGGGTARLPHPGTGDQGVRSPWGWRGG